MKSIFIYFLMISFCFSDYFSMTNLLFDEDKEFVFGENDEVKIIYKNNKIIFELRDDISDFMYEEVPTEYSHNKVKLKIYNLSYIVTNKVREKNFYLRSKKKYYLVQTRVLKQTMINPLFMKKEDVKIYDYKIIRKYNLNFDNEGKFKEAIITKFLNEYDNIVAIGFMNSGVFKIKKVTNNKIEQYNKLIEQNKKDKLKNILNIADIVLIKEIF